MDIDTTVEEVKLREGVQEDGGLWRNLSRRR